MSKGGRVPWFHHTDKSALSQQKWLSHVLQGKQILGSAGALSLLPTDITPVKRIHRFTNWNASEPTQEVPEEFSQVHTISNSVELCRILNVNNQSWIVGGAESIRQCVRWGYYPDIIVHTQVNEDYECDVKMPELRTWITSPLYRKTHSAIVGNTEVSTHAFFPNVRWHLDIVNNL